MSQDNNEAASGSATEAECRKNCDICMDEVGQEWPCAKAKAGKFAASASQSSTAGAAKGGSTCTKDGGECGIGGYCKDCHLAHVARQRQESAVDAALKDAAIHGTGMYILNPDGSTEHVSHGQFRAAVAEGGDTPEFRELLGSYVQAACDLSEASKGRRVKLLAYIETTYGAQQREAGRRDRDQDFGLLKLTLEQAQERLRQADAAIAERDAAVLARQPVSEGLTDEECSAILEQCVINTDLWAESQEHEPTRAEVDGMFVRAIVAAVPPAKAEGLTEAQQKTIRFAAEALEGLDLEDTAGDLRAILAQQAEKGGAA